jgi:threonine dehydratase
VILPAPRDVEAALGQLPRELRDTPCVRSTWLSRVAGHTVWLKLETLQPTHSFKVRGAATAIAAAQGAAARTPVVTASAGNHGAALAWAAARHGVDLVVFTPRNAPAAKRRRIVELGAQLRAVADGYDEAERLAVEWARREGLPYLSPYDDPFVIAGAGTMALEIARQVPQVDEVVVSLGGGGLLSGVLLGTSALSRPVRCVGAEAAASPAFTTALAAGTITPIQVGHTIADGLAGNLAAGSITFAIVKGMRPAVVTVEEPTVRRAVAQMLIEEHLVIEGAAGTAVGAVLDRRTSAEAGHTVVVLSGANIDKELLRALLEETG